jgi:hypothetical protein
VSKVVSAKRNTEEYRQANEMGDESFEIVVSDEEKQAYEQASGKDGDSVLDNINQAWQAILAGDRRSTRKWIENCTTLFSMDSSEINNDNITKIYRAIEAVKDDFKYTFRQKGGLNELISLTFGAGAGCVANIASEFDMAIKRYMIESPAERVVYTILTDQVFRSIVESNKGKDLLGGDVRFDVLKNQALTSAVINPVGLVEAIADRAKGESEIRFTDMQKVDPCYYALYSQIISAADDVITLDDWHTDVESKLRALTLLQSLLPKDEYQTLKDVYIDYLNKRMGDQKEFLVEKNTIKAFLQKLEEYQKEYEENYPQFLEQFNQIIDVYQKRCESSRTNIIELLENGQQSAETRREIRHLLMDLKEWEESIYSKYEEKEGLADEIINHLLNKPLLESSPITLREIFLKQELLEGNHEGKPSFKHILDQEDLSFKQKKLKSQEARDAVKEEAVEQLRILEKNVGNIKDLVISMDWDYTVQSQLKGELFNQRFLDILPKLQALKNQGVPVSVLSMSDRPKQSLTWIKEVAYQKNFEHFKKSVGEKALKKAENEENTTVTETIQKINEIAKNNDEELQKIFGHYTQLADFFCDEESPVAVYVNIAKPYVNDIGDDKVTLSINDGKQQVLEGLHKDSSGKFSENIKKVPLGDVTPFNSSNPERSMDGIFLSQIKDAKHYYHFAHDIRIGNGDDDDLNLDGGMLRAIKAENQPLNVHYIYLEPGGESKDVDMVLQRVAKFLTPQEVSYQHNASTTSIEALTTELDDRLQENKEMRKQPRKTPFSESQQLAVASRP